MLKKIKSVSLSVSLIFIALFITLFIMGKIPNWIAVIYLLFNSVTFIAYYKDKQASRRLGYRVPEIVLHSCSILGGWPAAGVAQQLFRHKTIKQPFRFFFWITIIINTTALIWFLTIQTP